MDMADAVRFDRSATIPGGSIDKETGKYSFELAVKVIYERKFIGAAVELTGMMLCLHRGIMKSPRIPIGRLDPYQRRRTLRSHTSQLERIWVTELRLTLLINRHET